MSSGLVMPKATQDFHDRLWHRIGNGLRAVVCTGALAASSGRRLPLFASSDWVCPLSTFCAWLLLEFLAGALKRRSLYYGARIHGAAAWQRFRRLLRVVLETAFALAGFPLCVMLGVATVLKPLLSDSAGLTELFIAAAFVVVIASTFFCRAYRDNARAQLQMGLLYLGFRVICVSVVSSGFGTRVNAGAGHHCDSVHPHRRAR